MTAFQAFRVFDEGGKIQGRVVETTIDELSAGEVVNQGAYSGVNYKDAMAATDRRNHPEISADWGIDVSGAVETSTDPRFKAGDQVLVTGYDFGVANDGGYAEYVRVPADWVVPIPPGLGAFRRDGAGTAGFTAAMSVGELERNGLTPSNVRSS